MAALAQSRRPYRPADTGTKPKRFEGGPEVSVPEEYAVSPDWSGDQEDSPLDPSGSSDGGGSNIYRDGAMNTPISQFPGSSVDYYDGTDLAKQFQNNRNLTQNEGDRYDTLFGGENSRRLGLENAALLRGQDLYGDLERTPGYTPQEQDRINREGEYYGLLNEDYGSNFLTDEEKQGITGDPYSAMNQLRPEELQNRNQTAYNSSRGYISDTGDQLNQSYGNLKDGLYGAVGEDLKLSGGYQGSISNIENTTDDRVWGAAKNPNLSMSGEYGRQAGMSDQEVEDAATQGGQAVGANYRSAVQDLERQAAASGNSSPLAVAAMRSQFEDQNAVAQADAVNNARLGARSMQRDAATGVEKTRLGAEQYKTGAEMDAGMGMGRFAADVETNRENMRLGATRDISNRNLGIASQLGDTSRANATYMGDRNLQNTRDWADRGQDAEKFNQQMGYGAARTAEQQQSDRAGAVATNRQGVNMDNQANRYNRGYQVASTQSGINTGIADARRTGQQELRNYYTGQQQYQGGQANQQQQNMLQNRSQTQQGRNTASQGSAGWELGNKNAPGFWQKHVAPVVSSVAQLKPKG
jgi:hypothetical protein